MLPTRSLRIAILAILITLGHAVMSSVHAADRSRIQAFLNVTGFDVALDSIALSAADAPVLLGIDAGDFGPQWSLLTRKVFDTAVMQEMAIGILEQTLDDGILAFASDFYASDLGQRLVAVENAAHMMDVEAKQGEGGRLVAEMEATGSPRLDLIERMNRAIDPNGSGVRALQEIQYRFLLAASAAGVVELRVDPGELRALLKRNESELREALRKSGLAASAYTYRDFSDADIEAYVEALEDDRMRQVYELLNAVQYEIMANRFEALAARMSGLKPGQDI